MAGQDAFPADNPDMRRKEMRFLAAALLAALILAAVVGIAIFYVNSLHGWHASRQKPVMAVCKDRMSEYCHQLPLSK